MFFALCPSELSDDYQTDYDEEARESALSDFDMSNPNSGAEHTEGEETADTADTDEEIQIRVRHHQTKRPPNRSDSVDDP